MDSPGVAYCYGCTIGVAESSDGGNGWIYRGALDLEHERGRNTFWAPEVVCREGVYHMYVSYTRGVSHRFFGHERMLHYASENLWDWKLEGEIALSSGSVIDACLHALPGGGFRMWYKNEEDKSHIWAADSQDLYAWRVIGPVITGCGSEGPNVFKLGGFYWMIVDCAMDGQGVYRSADLSSWARQAENILRWPGRRAEDGAVGSHADVEVCGDEACIFYFTHPERTKDYGAVVKDGLPHGMVPYALRRSSLQAARLTVENGVLICDRDQPFVMRLPM